MTVQTLAATRIEACPTVFARAGGMRLSTDYGEVTYPEARSLIENGCEMLSVENEDGITVGAMILDDKCSGDWSFVRMDASSWTQSKGPRGGSIWTNSKTGATRHSKENPGGKGKTPKAEKGSSADKKGSGVNHAISKIAKDILLIPTLKERKSDSLDFHEVAVWTVRDAMQKAFNAGQGKNSKPTKNTVSMFENMVKKYMDIDTLKTQKAGHLDFHEVGVESVRIALEKAYNAGKARREHPELHRRSKTRPQ